MNTRTIHRLSRRRFLKRTATTAGALGTLPWLHGANAATPQDVSGYKAMVCVLLAGGADSYNMLLPYDDTYYQRYADFRADLALNRDNLIHSTASSVAVSSQRIRV